MRKIGFSSGAIAYGDFQSALATLRDRKYPCLELSALRVSEFETLVAALPHMDLSPYSYISFHAPSQFREEEEAWIAETLFTGIPHSWPIIMHPDAIFDFSRWRRFGKRLAVENMDRRKPVGRTACELKSIFDLLPDASLCFDIGHARQCDASMTEAFFILATFRERLVQVHISEVNSASQHDRISHGAQIAFRQIAGMIPQTIPVIIESRVSESQLASEVTRALEALVSVRPGKAVASPLQSVDLVCGGCE